MATTTTAFLGAQPSSHMRPSYWADFLREALYPSLYLRQLGTLVTLPRGMGSKVRISRWQSPIVFSNGAASVSGHLSAVGHVAEGTAATVRHLCASSITGQITGFEGAYGYTDKIVITSMANFIEGAVEALSHETAMRLDTYTRTNTSANAFTQYAISPASAAATANKVPTANVLNGKNIARIKPLLAGQGIPTWEDGTYVGVAHGLAAHDMFTDTSAHGLITVARYSNAKAIYRGEVCEFYGIRWLMTPAAPRIYGATTTTATYGISAGASGSNAYIYSPDSFYTLEYEGGGVEVIHQPLGSAGTADATAKLGSVGIKVFYGALATPSAERRYMRYVHGLALHY